MKYEYDKQECQIFLEYELANASWWVSFIFWEWGQRLVGKYFSKKAYRKYCKFLQYRKMLEEIQNQKIKTNEKINFSRNDHDDHDLL